MEPLNIQNPCTSLQPSKHLKASQSPHGPQSISKPPPPLMLRTASRSPKHPVRLKALAENSGLQGIAEMAKLKAPRAILQFRPFESQGSQVYGPLGFEFPGYFGVGRLLTPLFRSAFSAQKGQGSGWKRVVCVHLSACQAIQETSGNAWHGHRLKQ